MGNGGDDRPDPWPDPGRLADRVLQLALGVLHQSAAGYHRLRRHGPVHAGFRALHPRLRQVRLPAAGSDDRQRPAADGPRRDRRLVRLPRDPALLRPGRFQPVDVRDTHAAHRQPVPVAGGVQGPQPGHQSVLHLLHRHHSAGHHGPAAALHAEPDGLPRAGCGHPDGAPRHGHHGGDDGGGQAEQPGGRQSTDSVRAAVHCALAQRHDPLQHLCTAVLTGVDRRAAGLRTGFHLRAPEHRGLCHAGAAVPGRRCQRVQPVPQHGQQRGHLDGDGRAQSQHVVQSRVSDREHHRGGPGAELEDSATGTGGWRQRGTVDARRRDHAASGHDCLYQ